jgi:uncharacterized protein
MIATPITIACLSPRRLHLILMPTEACNFRCVYCYESFALKQMKPEVVAGVKRLLARRAPGLRSLTLSWFGGEPLLAPSVIEEIMTHARCLEGAYPDLAVRSDITTNGYLLSRPMADRLLSLAVCDLQVSLDGPRALHDRKRVRLGGLPTFDRIWENLLALRARPDRFRVTLRLHVDRDNLDSVPDLLRALAGEFSTDDRFEVFVRAIARLGGPRDATLPVLAEEESARALVRLRDEASRLGLKLAQANAGDPVCYAAHANSFLIRADGRLNKCTVALDLPANQVGRIHEDGTLELDRKRTLAWSRGLDTDDAKALACPLQGINAAQEQAPLGTLAVGVPV